MPPALKFGSLLFLVTFSFFAVVLYGGARLVEPGGAAILSADKGVPQRRRAAARKRATAYFRLAYSYTRRQAFRGAILISGPSGSGKSVLAGTVAARLGACLLSTDTLRRQLFSDGGRDSALNTGIYTPESRQQIYDLMRQQAERLLREGRGIVLDGTFTKRRERAAFLGLVRDATEPLLVVECWAPDDVIRSRQSRRAGDTWSKSEGSWEVYLAQKAAYEPPDEVPEAERIVIDTTLPIAEQLELVEARFRRT
jgi:predicted kinase